MRTSLYDYPGKVLWSRLRLRPDGTLTGFRETELMGKDVVEALGLSGFETAQNPASIALEWGVRRLGEELELRTRAGLVKPVVVDLFPAYDDDGGLLVALSSR